jgi:hypothetical protein
MLRRTACALTAALVLLSGAPNAALDLESDGIATHVDVDGAELSIGVTIRASALGRGDAAHALGASSPSRLDAEVRTVRGSGVIEWWRPMPDGLEHGVTLDARPQGSGDLWIDLAVRGLTPTTIDDDTIALTDGGREVARYGGLVVLDADDARLPARLRAVDERIRIEVDDHAARYPIVIDPFVYAVEATLPPSSSATDARAGMSVSMTPDGTRIIVGEPGGVASPPDTPGQATVWVRAGTSWTQEAVLSVSGLANGAYFGGAVSIAANGALAAVGAPYDAAGAGQVYVFSRSGTTWTQTAVFGEPSFVTGSALFGRALAISPDGADILVLSDTSGSFDWQMHWNGTIWNPNRANFLNPTGAGWSSLAWSGDSARFAAGCPSCSSNAGVAVVMTRAPFTAETTVTGAANEQIGMGVALDGAGTRLAITDFGGSAVLFHARNTSTNAWSLETRVATSSVLTRVAMVADGSIAYGTSSSVYAFRRIGTSWVADGYDVSLFTNAILQFATTQRGERIAIGTPTVNGTNPYAGATTVLHVRLPQGYACAASADCGSGFCVDGVCCDGACGGGYVPGGSNCSACVSRYTGGADGTCASLTATYAVGITCRASSAPCEGPATCSPTDVVCPANPFLTGIVCRNPTNSCQLAATCDGTASACPANPPGNAGAVCRAVASTCDVAESCDGVAPACPTDTFVAAGTMCRVPSDLCDAPGICTGTSPTCPPDAPQPNTHMCRAAVGMGCDSPAFCTGSTTSCPANPLMAAGTPCGSRPVVGVCDVADVCNGVLAACPDTFATGITCRAATGACDVAESCSGTSANCPADAVEGAGTVCRASTASCDPAESCDGTSHTCPPDTTTCTSMPDAGVHDAAIAIDAGSDVGTRDGSIANDAASSVDAASAPPPIASGCGCATGSPRPGAWVVLAALAWLARLGGRRRRGS